MSKTLDNIRLNLCFFSGEDDYIIRKCSKKIQIFFAFIGLFVIIVFLGCFISAFEFTTSVFIESGWLVMPFIIGLIWAFLVANMYLLLLYTISPTLLPVSNKKKKHKQKNKIKDDVFSISLILRILFISLLAIIIAQPLSVFHFSYSIDEELQKHKNLEQALMIISFDSTSINNQQKLFKDFNNRIKIFKSEYPLVINSNNKLINKLNDDINNLYQINSIQKNLLQKRKLKEPIKIYEKKKDSLNNELINISNNIVNSDANILSLIDGVSCNSKMLYNDFILFRNEIKQIIESRNKNHNRISIAISECNYYTTKIKLLLQHNPISWLLTFLICIVFILPIYLKYALRDLSKNYFKEDFKDKLSMYKIREEMLITKDFTWLKNNLQKLNINEIKTSDFYFQKMLIEYKIILEDYEEFKLNHSKILKERIQSYNSIYKGSLKLKLDQLLKTNSINYKDFVSEVKVEFDKTNDSFEKYEYWEDAPFRTLKRNEKPILGNDEEELLRLIYPVQE